MANKVSAKKMIRKIAKKTERNRSLRSRYRTFIKSVEQAVEAGNKELALQKFSLAESIMQKTISKGIFHIKRVSRKISRLSLKIKKMEGSFVLPSKKLAKLSKN